MKRLVLICAFAAPVAAGCEAWYRAVDAVENKAPEAGAKILMSPDMGTVIYEGLKLLRVGVVAAIGGDQVGTRRMKKRVKRMVASLPHDASAAHVAAAIHA